MTNWYSIQARGTVGEIAIFDEIGGPGLDAGDFDKKLKALGKVSAINLSINSPAGNGQSIV